MREWFGRDYKGKEIANTIIDFVNIGVLDAASTLSCIYITEEKGFVELIGGLRDERVKATRAFYKQFYNGWERVKGIKTN